MIKPLLKASYPVKGQILSEHGLAIALVSIASIGGLLYFQDQLQALWSGYDFGSPMAVAAVPSLPGNGSNSGVSGNGSNGNSNSNNAGGGSGSPMSIRLADGTMVDIGNYPTSLTKAIETSGINGTTEQLLASLEAMAESLAAQGKLTPEQSSAYSRLANLGHEIANVEQVVEETMAQCNSSLSCLQNTQIIYKGQAYPNIYDFQLNKLGYDEGYATNCSSSPTGCVGRETPSTHLLQQNGISTIGWVGSSQDFASEYVAIQSNGMLSSSPELNTIVTSLASQVLLMSDALETSTNMLRYASGTTYNTVPNLIAAQMTDIDSAGICLAGGGIDTSNACH